MPLLRDYNELARKLRCRFMFSQEKLIIIIFVAIQDINLLLLAIRLEKFIELTKIELSFF